MNIYHYHPVTGEFLGKDVADPDPLEEGCWLVPAHATTVEPPKFKKNEVPVFDGEGWSVKWDFRGATLWNTLTREALVPTVVGEPSDPEAWTMTAPGPHDRWDGRKWVLSVEALRTAKAREISVGASEAVHTARRRHPDAEVATWGTQEAQAKEVVKDPAARCHLLRELAVVRGISPTEMAGRILRAKDEHEAEVARILVKARKYEKQLERAKTAEAIQKISVNYDDK
jgi:hypothetical protein